MNKRRRKNEEGRREVGKGREMEKWKGRERGRGQGRRMKIQDS